MCNILNKNNRHLIILYVLLPTNKIYDYFSLIFYLGLGFKYSE